MLKRVYYFGTKEIHHLPAGVEVSREEAFAHEEAAQVFGELVFDDRLEVMAAKVPRPRECSRYSRLSGHFLIRKQSVIAEAEIHVLDRVNTPSRAKTYEIGRLPYARLVNVAVNVVHLAPLWPSPPQHVEHFIVPRFWIIPGKKLKNHAQLVVHFVLEQVADLAVHAKSIEVLELAVRRRRRGCAFRHAILILFPSELIRPLRRIVPVLCHQTRYAAANG